MSSILHLLAVLLNISCTSARRARAHLSTAAVKTRIGKVASSSGLSSVSSLEARVDLLPGDGAISQQQPMKRPESNRDGLQDVVDGAEAPHERFLDSSSMVDDPFSETLNTSSEDKAKRGSLGEYFLHGHYEGLPLPDDLPYEYSQVSISSFAVPTYRDLKTGIEVLAAPMDLCSTSNRADCIALFHYTDFRGFANIADPHSSKMELWAAIWNKGAEEPYKSAKFGEGVYATIKEPADFQNKTAVIINNYSNKKIQSEKTLSRRQGKADFCIVLVASRSDAYDVRKELPPDARDLGWEAGETRKGEALREDRDVWVVQVKENGQIVNPSVSLEKHFMTLVEKRLRMGDTNNPLTVKWMSCLAMVFEARGEFHRAEEMCRSALSTAKEGTQAALSTAKKGTSAGGRKGMPERQRLMKQATNILVTALVSQGKIQEAEDLQRSAVSVMYNDETFYLEYMSNQARVSAAKEQYNVAEYSDRIVLNARKDKLGPTHPETLISIITLASHLDSQGKLQEAEDLNRLALNGLKGQLGSTHSSTLVAMSNLASVLGEKGKFQESELLLRTVVNCNKKKKGPTHPHTLASSFNLATSLRDQSKVEEAEEIFSTALSGASLRRLSGNGNPFIPKPAARTASTASTVSRSRARTI